MGVRSLTKRPSSRATAQRQLLLDIIRNHEGHLDADQIYLRACQEQPYLSLSTVYRNLKLFKEQGLVEEHRFDSARRCYEAKPERGHHHLVCLRCGGIMEFNCPSTKGLRDRIGKEQGFEVTEVEVRLAGYCPECQQLLANGEADAGQRLENAERR